MAQVWKQQMAGCSRLVTQTPSRWFTVCVCVCAVAELLADIRAAAMKLASGAALHGGLDAGYCLCESPCMTQSSSRKYIRAQIHCTSFPQQRGTPREERKLVVCTQFCADPAYLHLVRLKQFSVEEQPDAEAMQRQLRPFCVSLNCSSRRSLHPGHCPGRRMQRHCTASPHLPSLIT